MRKNLLAAGGLVLLSVLGACQGSTQLDVTASSIPQNIMDLEKKRKPVQTFYPEDEANEVSKDETGNEIGEDESDGDGIITVTDPESVEVVVNKQRKLPENYKPDDLVVPDVPFSFDGWNEKKQLREPAARALEQLFQAAEKEGLHLVAVSGFRSFERQQIIYNNNVNANGEEHANQFSARPGHSEHQTGLAMDVSSATVSFHLIQSFGETPEGKWLNDHAHEFGFIIRYPEGKSEITGYAYEPWHLRYTGKELATEMYNNQVTMEEFFGLLPEEEVSE